MDYGYIRLSRAGPTREEQEAALLAAGVALDLGRSLFLDPVPKRGRTASYEQRDIAIRALRPGDRLVIHSPPRLGSTEADLRDAAAAVAAQGAALYDCAAGAEVRHHPDAGRLIVWARDGAALAAKERLSRARQGITKRGAPPKALTPAKLKRARELWADLDRSVDSIAKQLGVSPRTLYRHLHKRGST